MAIVESTHTAEALAERIFGATVEGMYLAGIHIGRELGLYAALRDGGPQTSSEVASRAGCDERYVREWLEHQAVGGILVVDDERRYDLPDGHAEALLDMTSPNLASPLATFLVGEMQPLDATIDAFRTGKGVSYDAYPVCRVAQAEFNRPMFVHQLAAEWMPALPEIDHAFRERGGRVADVACGAGWSSIEIARAYPKVRVDGYDPDGPSIAMAEQNLQGSGVDHQVRFYAEDGATARAPEGYDLVTVFEAIHDMANPVEVLSNARGLLAPGGVVMVADEKVAHEFHAPADEVEQLMYGFSVLFCLPTGREGEPSAATGTAMRPHTMQGYADAAGFSDFQVLPIEHDLWRFYLLIP